MSGGRTGFGEGPKRGVGGARAQTGAGLGTALCLLALVLTLGASQRGSLDTDEAAPRRVVSLVPAATRIVVAVGATDRLVARTADDLTPEAASLPVVGRVLGPDLERIRALEPDLVLAWDGSPDDGVRRVADAAGAQLLRLRLERLSHVSAGVVAVGRALGVEEKAARFAASIEAELAGASRSARGLGGSALWVVWAEPPIVAGPGTLPHDLLTLLGVDNVMAAGTGDWPRPSWEALLRADPTRVVWPEGPGVPALDALDPSSPWRALPAVREGRVVVVDPDLMHEAGPRVGRAADRLAGLFRSITTHSKDLTEGASR